jgi:hypothetical protein
MKKLTITFIIFLFPVLSYSQVFNTASTLSPGKFSLGINPLFYEKDFGLFLHGGVGIKPGLDLAIHYGILDYNDYVGADLEWRLVGGKGPKVSLITGAHNYNDFGLDLGLNLSFTITSNVQLYTGIDSDINFGQNDTYTPLWLPIGVEIPVKSKMSFMFEAEVPLSDAAWSIFGGGLAFYF